MNASRIVAAARAILVLVAANVALGLAPSAAGAQGYTRAIPCPTNLTLRFLGMTTFRHAGHAWDTGWTLRMLIKDGEGYYVPPGQPYRITSTDGEAVWKNPGIVVACMEYAVDLYFLEVKAEYWVKIFLGKVEEICQDSGGGGGGGGGGLGGTGGSELIEHSTIYGDTYDPYVSEDLGDEFGGCSDGAGSGETSTGTQYEPGDNTGGETVDWGTGIGNGGTSVCGTAAIVEYICIDLWDADSGTWNEWSCGYATTC
jgi:hypothetical protein